jgi:hypothetical protein
MKYDNGDIDDLFRRAAEKYPLRTDSVDWDRLASALAGGAAAPSDQEKKRRRRGVLLWFLLIPLAGVGYLTWQVRAHHSSEKGIAAAQVSGIAVMNEGNGNRPTNGSSGSSVAGGKEVRKMRTPGDSGVNIGTTQSAVVLDGQHVAGTTGTDNGVSGGGKVRSLRTNSGHESGGDRVGDGSDKRNRDMGAGLDKTMGDGQSGGRVVDGPTGSRVADNRSGKRDRSSRLEGSDIAQLSGAGANGEDRDPALAALDLRRASIGGRYPIDVRVVAPAAAAKNPPPPGPDKKKNSHGYIGVLGAPDFSTVHYQSMKGVGTTFGVLLGYSFNERWAVESGLYLDRKRYYTAGEYFNTEKVSMPTGYYKLLNVDGTCNMWEIPVNVRYNFSTSPRMKWFATAGLSTYLMTSENYTYQVQNNWSTEDSSWHIRRPSRYLFSIVNLSAGFEQRIGKIGNLRLEPYVRIPLSGIGTGNLPIMSAGLNIGFTRQLW